MEQNNILSLQNMVKSYSGVTVLDGVSLDVKKGEVHALIGANGAYAVDEAVSAQCFLRSAGA